ncbi:MAG: Amuc_1098 family type IV pilus outer membrane protein [Akkermansiaceae bacterium]
MVNLKLNIGRGLLSGLLICSGPVMAQQDILARETAARSADARVGYSLIEEGDVAYRKGDFQTAVEKYSVALTKLPVGAPVVAGLRGTAVQRFSQASLARARELMRVGDSVKASALMDQVDEVDPDNPKVKQFRAKMNDPIRNNPALTPEHATKVDRVRQLLYQAQGFYDLGQFDRAYLTYEDVLRIDPHSVTARRGMERVNSAKSGYAVAARDQARSKMLTDVAAQWEQRVFKEDQLQEVGGSIIAGPTMRVTIEEKLNSIMVPELRLSGASLSEAVEFLRVVSAREDRGTLDEQRKGVPFVVQLGDESHPAIQKIRSARINLTLNNIPLREVVRRVTEATGTTFRVDDFAVVLNAAGFDDPTLIRREFRVPPDFLTNGEVNQQEADNDPFADKPANGALVAKALTAKERLQSYDVSFPEGASASYNRNNSVLTVLNTAANIRLVEAIVAELAKTEPVIVKISTTILDCSQENLEDLGFDFVAGQVKVGSNGFLSGGTIGSGTEINDMVSGAPVTAGNRSGQLVPSGEGLDGLLDRQPPESASAVVSNDGAGTSVADIRLPSESANTASRAPGILSLRGVIDDSVFELLMRGISQKKGVDLMTRPEVVTRPGQNATIESISEFPYPEDFEPPQLPNAVGGGGAAVTPATPTNFTYKNLGVTLEVLPQVGPNREVIEVSVIPTVTDFEGFINYGTPISGSTNNTTINLTNGTVGNSSIFGELTQNAILKPLFRTIRGNIPARIVDGETIVLGGMVEEIRKEINDKVPILGDIPMIGRIFRQNGMSVEKRSILIFLKVELTDPAGNLYRDR